MGSRPGISCHDGVLAKGADPDAVPNIMSYGGKWSKLNQAAGIELGIIGIPVLQQACSPLASPGHILQLVLPACCS